MKVLSGCLTVILVVAVLAGGLAWYFSDFELSVKNNRIGVVEIKGTISGSQETLKQIKEFRKDNSVKAIIVRIDSPGGAVGPCQEVFAEIRRTVKTKPVVASMGAVAASAGYYIACAADHIIANPGTITGSIGVIIFFPNLRELFDKIGYQMTAIKSGQYKDVGNPAREMTQEEREMMQATINVVYSQFVRDVALMRKMSEDEVRRIADGRIIMGETAAQLKLIDQLGNFEDAVLKAAELGKIEGEPEVLPAKKKSISVLDLLVGGDMSEKLNGIVPDSSAFLRYQMQDIGGR